VLTVTIQNAGDLVILHCQGRIVRGEESALLCAAVRQHGQDQDIVLDLADVIAIDATGIGALVSLQAAGIYLKLINPSEQVRYLLRITGLNSVIEICDAATIEGLLLQSKTKNRHVAALDITDNPLQMVLP